MHSTLRYNPIELGQRLLEILNEKNTTQRALAGMLGIDETVVSKIINGKNNLTLPNMDAVCLCLGTTPSHLMYGIGPKYLK